MMDISAKNPDGVLTVSISGRIDSSNSAELEKQLDAIRDAEAHNAIVFDLENLEYISSAGLRVLLRVRKADPTLKLVNVSPDVYEILDMTGFAEIIPTEKAYRRLSVDGCEVIGRGANGEVYRLDNDTIIKVYLNPDSLPDIQRERELARKAFVLDIPTAIPYDVVKVGSSYGSVFELLNAQSFAKLISTEPENFDKYAKLYVDLLKKIHSTTVLPEDMPDMREVALGWANFDSAYLPNEEGEKLISLVSAVPVVHKMMHGDYHVKNVMMQNGEVLLIDMDTLCQGHPVFELASIYNAYVGFLENSPDTAQSFLGIDYETSQKLWRTTLSLYLGTEDADRLREVEDKAALVGYTRLMRRLIRRSALESEEGRALVELYKGHILKLLDTVDTLEF